MTLSILFPYYPGVRIKRDIFREIICHFQCRDKRNCPLYTGIHIEQESVVRGSTVKFIKVNKVVIIFESEDDLL